MIVNKATAAISKNAEVSEQVAINIAKLKPDLVIAAQTDRGICTPWLVVDVEMGDVEMEDVGANASYRERDRCRALKLETGWLLILYY